MINLDFDLLELFGLSPSLPFSFLVFSLFSFCDALRGRLGVAAVREAKGSSLGDGERESFRDLDERSRDKMTLEEEGGVRVEGDGKGMVSKGSFFLLGLGGV